MEKRIFIVNGKPRAGKDTFAKLLELHFKVYKYSIIDKVKDIATVCGCKGKELKDRKFLNDLKNLTTEYNDMSFNDVAGHVDIFAHSKNDIMLIDMREPDDIKRAIDEFGAETIFIENCNVPEITNNPADKNVYDMDYDYVIVNNHGILEFITAVEMFADMLNYKGE